MDESIVPIVAIAGCPAHRTDSNMLRRKPMSMTTTTTSPIGETTLHHSRHLNGKQILRETAEKPRMVRLTVNLPSNLVEQMRDAVYWTPGLTLAWVIARALRTSLTELESTNHGPFPRRSKPLRAGRPRLLGQSMKVQCQSPAHGSTPSIE
jgi:hypothetical protein